MNSHLYRWQSVGLLRRFR